jgi:hypothetical protein
MSDKQELWQVRIYDDPPAPEMHAQRGPEKSSLYKKVMDALYKKIARGELERVRGAQKQTVEQILVELGLSIDRYELVRSYIAPNWENHVTKSIQNRAKRSET